MVLVFIVSVPAVCYLIKGFTWQSSIATEHGHSKVLIADAEVY